MENTSDSPLEVGRAIKFINMGACDLDQSPSKKQSKGRGRDVYMEAEREGM